MLKQSLAAARTFAPSLRIGGTYARKQEVILNLCRVRMVEGEADGCGFTRPGSGARRYFTSFRRFEGHFV